jgi:hypothetical protein
MEAVKRRCGVGSRGGSGGLKKHFKLRFWRYAAHERERGFGRWCKI